MQQSYLSVTNKYQIAWDIAKLSLSGEAFYVFIQTSPSFNNLVGKLIKSD